MKAMRLTLTALAVVLGLVATPGIPDAPDLSKDKRFQSPEKLLQAHLLEEAILEKEAPEDAYLFQKIFTGGTPSREAFAAAARDARESARRTAASSPRLARRKWSYIGPSNIGGRVVDITTDPRRENTIFVASASGGMWKSTDRGKTFRSIWSKRRTQAMGALAQGRDGTLWLGTGEANPGGGSLTYFGNGVYKSTNRGKTWRNVGLRGTSRIGRIAVDPKDPKHVLVAATGNLFDPGGPRGLYETKNGGRTWNRILKGENPTTGAVDVAIDPKNPRNIYVTMWDHLRYPDYRRYTGPGSGIWRSTNGGRTFEELIVGLPPGNEITGGRIGIAIDPKNPQRLWAIYANNNEGSFAGFFMSVDGGDTWTAPPSAQTSLSASQSVYGWWFGRIFVDPYDPNHVYVTGLYLLESKDGGLTFPTIHLQPHVDHHAMAWDPHKKTRVYNGNDGGVYRSERDGANGSWIHGKKQPWMQFFTLDVSAQRPGRVNGGLQDQGSVRTWPDKWNQYYGGDGVENAINPKDKMNVYACSQYGACGESDDGGNSFEEWECQQMQSTRCGWQTPIEFQPGKPKVVYWAGDRIARSSDQGETWEPISPDLGEGEAGRETNPLYAGHYGTVQAIGLNKKKPKVIYAGTDNHRLWKTKDLGGTWRKITDKKLPKRWVTDIAVKLNRPRVLYVSYSGYRNDDQSAYVFRSKNGGKTWRNISRSLPRAPVNDLVLVRRKLYAATDVGVFVTKTRGVRWLKVGRGLPLAPVNDIEFVRKNRSLYAGTFGRGVYKITPPRRFRAR